MVTIITLSINVNHKQKIIRFQNIIQIIILIILIIIMIQIFPIIIIIIIIKTHMITIKETIHLIIILIQAQT